VVGGLAEGTIQNFNYGKYDFLQTFLYLKAKIEYNCAEVRRMQRKIMEKLIAWKQNEVRQPLLIHGARQVGKTYVIREFGNNEYENTIYINFENNKRIADYFDEDISPARLIKFFESSFNERILPRKTLIIFDEIQTCERALTSLKYFNEDAPEYDIVAAGSLLGVAINREKYSFPVGKIESLTVYPLDFEEYLWALGRERLCDEIRLRFESNEKMPAPLHQELLELYKYYLIVGGMPKVVSEYVKTGSLYGAVEVQNEIMNNYIADMSKYASSSESIKIRACYNSIPNQLAKENKKFQYKVVQNGGNSTIFGESIEWLNFAGVVLKCQKAPVAQMPIAVHTDLTSFKLYMSDVGLLTMKSGILQSMILSNVEFESNFIGAIAENYVAVALHSKGYPLYYWQSENTAEIDFIMQTEDGIVPIEVKAGAHTKSRSLSVFREKYAPKYVLRISAKNFGFENGIKSVPLYAVFCI